MSEPVKHGSMPAQAEPSASSSVPVILPVAACRWKRWVKAIWRLGVCSSTAVAVLVAVGGAHAEPIASNPNASSAVTADLIAISVAEASRRFAIPSSWIRAVMHRESLGDARALSPKGAMGLMQIMPETWAELRLRYGLGTDPYDPRDNITAGAAYLRELHDRYGERGFLAAYNAGPGRYENHLATGRPLPAETLSYVAAVASLIGARTDAGGNIARVMAPSWTSATLFVPHSAPGPTPSRPPSSGQTPRGPVDRKAPSRAALTPLSDGLFAETVSRSGRP